MPQELFITVDTLLRRLSMKRQGALTLLCKFTLSNFVPRISGLLLLGLAVSHSPHAAARDDIVSFQAGGTPLVVIDQKVQPIDVDHCGGEVASIGLPTDTDATLNVVRIQSGGIIVSQVERLKVTLLTSDGRGVNSLGEELHTADLSYVAAQTQSVQRAVAFEEDRNDPRGKSYSGFVSWHIGMAVAHRDADVQRTMQAEVDLPDQGLNFVLCMWPNNNQSLSASHTIAVIFAQTSGTQHGGISALAGITMKRQLVSQGVGLSGVVSKVADNSFRLALSGAELERQRNLKLLKEESWMGILIRYNDRLRALIALEKSVAVSDALATWK